MKCKRLSAAILSLVMIISLLPTTALAAEKNNVWSTAYDEIRVYMDDATEADHDNLKGILPKQVRLYTSKALLGEYVFCMPGRSYWEYSNRGKLSQNKVTATDITSINLVRDKATDSSPKISIPIEGNTKYKVTVSQEHHQGDIILGHEVGGYDYLRIYISRRTPHNVTYEFSGTAGVNYPSSVTPPEDTNTYTETSVVDLKQPAKTTVTGKKDGQDGIWTFNGWQQPEGITFTDNDTKFTMPDTNVTVTGTWTFEATPPTGTPVYVYFQTVHSQDGDVRVNDGDGVTYNNNTGGWATLGKLTTEQPVSASKDKTEVGKLGAEVKDVDDDPNTKFERYKVNGNVINGNVGISLIDWESIVLEPNGAADYVGFGTEAWHLNGKVNVYKLSYNANLPTGVTAGVTVPDSAYYLPNWNATVSTDDPTLQGYVFGGWYTEETFEHKVEKTVTVSKDTVLYAKWTPAQPTADLIDDNITIKHGVNADPEHGVNADPEHGNDDDTNAHIVKKNATISYQATLDMKNLKFGANPEHKTAVSFIEKQIGTRSLWEFMQGENITMFAGSKVNLHVKFSEELVNPATLNGITLESGWFKRDPASNPTYDETTKYWTIPCVIKNANAEDAPDTSKSIITLSGVSLPLTADAQGKLSSDTALDITSGGYIDGTIKIYTYELSLIGKSKEAPAENTAKLKLAAPTYSVTYTDGANGSAFKDQVYSGLKSGVATPAFNGTPTRSGYTFNGWTPAVAKTVTGDATYTATWTRNSGRDDDDDKYFFAIQKVDAQDGHALNGAKFELYQLDNRGNKLPASRKTTSHWGTESGIALFSVSATKTSNGGSTWYYREITAPEGYVLDSTEHKIKAANFSGSRSTAVQNAVTVRNYRGTTPDLLNDSDHFAYVIGYMDGNVRPYGLISRAETTTIFFRLLKDSVRDGNLLTSNTYTDVADDYWANTAISTMTGLGIVQGRSTTTFDPKAPITRAQFAAICARFDTGKSSGEQTFSDIQGHWAEKYIERAAELGWIKGFEDGTFRPDTYITRAQAMTMINRVLNRIPEDESDLLPGMNVWPDCNPGDWFYLAVQEATNSHDYKHKAGNYETWTRLTKDPDWTRYEN